jgi:integrase
MNFVEPIRDRKKIAQIKNLLRGQKRFRDLLLFVVGINTALRISDLLQLQINHFLDEQKRVKRRFWIKERKRGKRHKMVINSSIREALATYLMPEWISPPSQRWLVIQISKQQHAMIAGPRKLNSARQGYCIFLMPDVQLINKNKRTL